MSRSRFKVGDVLVVHWIDAHTVDEWTDRHDLESKTKPADCMTVGWFLRRDKDSKSLILAHTTAPGNDGEVMGIVAIPRAFIKEVIKLEYGSHKVQPEPNSKAVHRKPSEGGPVQQPNGGRKIGGLGVGELLPRKAQSRRCTCIHS
jgi:hypothetical protein